ncbi:hypothetical protein [Nocardiopsis halotolerans]|uniref:hypothetical protein n=1 Tax=Nocardiopsis halotolerans TaxID=124252 RepID=UPI00034AB65F|nr:hypothetical protein [Nocardiopsis halotolerans]
MYGGPGPQPPKPASQGAAIGALIANILGLCGCWTLAIVGLVLAIVAVTQVNTNPKSARTCTLISWILFGAGIAIWLVLFFVYGAMGFLSVLGSSSSY